jgi:hypothetical protein
VRPELDQLVRVSHESVNRAGGEQTTDGTKIASLQGGERGAATKRIIRSEQEIEHRPWARVRHPGNDLADAGQDLPVSELGGRIVPVAADPHGKQLPCRPAFVDGLAGDAQRLSDPIRRQHPPGSLNEASADLDASGNGASKRFQAAQGVDCGLLCQSARDRSRVTRSSEGLFKRFQGSFASHPLDGADSSTPEGFAEGVWDSVDHATSVAMVR